MGRTSWPVIARLTTFACLLVAGGCSSESAPRRVDGGAFVLPDGGFRDASFRDIGVDAGNPPCVPLCADGEACGCLELPGGRSCGCHPVGMFGDPCDPGVPETCQADLRCVASRRGVTTYRCSDGRPGSLCSRLNVPDVCATALGCVCLTGPSGMTTCTCENEADPDNPLCDPQVPQTCTRGDCVRATGPGGITYFVCSDGSLGSPCERGSPSCRTSLGCTCPVVQGLARCQCSEPSNEGGPCDLEVAGGCLDGLFCIPQRDLNGVSTICSSEVPDAGTNDLPCNPLDPMPCPAGLICRQNLNGGFTCQPG